MALHKPIEAMSIGSTSFVWLWLSTAVTIVRNVFMYSSFVMAPPNIRKHKASIIVFTSHQLQTKADIKINRSSQIKTRPVVGAKVKGGLLQ
jgi:hypothetical protein